MTTTDKWRGTTYALKYGKRYNFLSFESRSQFNDLEEIKMHSLRRNDDCTPTQKKHYKGYTTENDGGRSQNTRRVLEKETGTTGSIRNQRLAQTSFTAREVIQVSSYSFGLICNTIRHRQATLFQSYTWIQISSPNPTQPSIHQNPLRTHPNPSKPKAVLQLSINHFKCRLPFCICTSSRRICSRKVSIG